MMTNLFQVTMFQGWMLKLIAVSCLLVAFQGFSPGKMIKPDLTHPLGESQSGFLWRDGLDLADYKPTKGTGKPDDSTGAGGRTFRIEIPS